MGKVLFLSAMAYLAYRYIAKSNRKVREIADQAGTVQILPPERTAGELPPGRAVELLPPAKPVHHLSDAAETNPTGG